MAWTFKEWYSNNKEALNAKRKHRYHTDPDYRAKVIEQNRKSREKRRLKKLEEQNKLQTQTTTQEDKDEQETNP